LSIDKPIRYW